MTLRSLLRRLLARLRARPERPAPPTQPGGETAALYGAVNYAFSIPPKETKTITVRLVNGGKGSPSSWISSDDDACRWPARCQCGMCAP